MLIHKTPQERRNTYTYHFNDGTSMTLCPGENGITELDIKRLHAADDSEIYYNLKAIDPEKSLPEAERKELRAKKEDYAKKFKTEFQEKYGYEPHPSDVADAVKEFFAKSWVCSLDQMLDGNSDSEGYGDKSSILLQVATGDDKELSPCQERMRELVSTLPEKEQIVYWRVMVNDEKKYVVAKSLGISDTRVSQITKKIEGIFRNDEILKKICRVTSD